MTKFYDVFYQEEYFSSELYRFFQEEEEYESQFDPSYVPGKQICRCSSPKAAISIILDEMKKLGLSPKHVESYRHRNIYTITNKYSDGLWSIRITIV